MDEKQLLREQIISYIRKLPDSGWCFSTSGNMSVRCSDGHLLITPSTVDYEYMQPEDIFEIDADGNIVKPGKNKPTSSLRFHVAVQKARPDINVVFHTHAPYSLATSTVIDHVPPVTLNSMLLIGRDGINVAAYGENGSVDEAEKIVKALGKEYHGCLMQNHGVVTIGETIRDAWINMGYTEDCCKTWLFAKSTGLEVSYIK